MKLLHDKDMVKKIILCAIPIVMVLCVFSISLARAQSLAAPGPIGGGGTAPVASGGSMLDDIGYYVIGKIVFVISYVIAWIAGVGIAIETWLVGAMLGLNSGVFEADIVQKGFGIMLAIANLGFVLGIIIVAISTIFQSQTYGFKKLLAKLIVAAILVNFSLVIAAPIFGLANSFTQYFLNCTDSTVGCNAPQGASAFTSMNDFAARLAGAFNPQDGLASLDTDAKAIDSNSISLGQGLGKMLVPILSLLFVAFELISIEIVLGVLIFMLLVRYVYIAILAILMPFAWLGWAFPAMKNWWSRWWQTFIRWTFFAPVVVLFLYLAMVAAESMRNGTSIASQSFGTYTSSSNFFWAAIANFFTNALSPIVAQFLNIFVLVGLSVGGLMVANNMSITGAKAGMDAVKAVGNSVKGYALRRGKQATTAPLRSQRGRNLASRLQQGPGTGLGSRILEGTGLGFLKRQSGRAIEAGAIAGGERAVEAAKKVTEGLTPGQRMNRLTTIENPYQRMAMLKQVMEDKNIGKLSPAEMEDYFGKDKEDVFKRYGQQKLYSDLRENSGLVIADLDKKIAGLRTTDPDDKLPETIEAVAERNRKLSAYLRYNTDSIAESFADPKKLKERQEAAAKTGRVPAMLDNAWLDRLQKNITEGVADGLSPENVSSLIKALSQKNNLDTFQDAVTRHKTPAIVAKFKANKKIQDWNDKQVGRGVLDINLKDLYT